MTIKSTILSAAKSPATAGIYIKSISVSATYSAAYPPVMTIVWSMPDTEIHHDGLSMPGVDASVRSRPSDTTILLYRELMSPAEMEDGILSAAWELGAWDLVRSEHAPRAPGDNWREARYGICSSFGRNDYIIAGQALSQGESAPEAAMAEAAKDGFVTWRFIPLSLAHPVTKKQWGPKDKTLSDGLTRAGNIGDYRESWKRPREPLTAADHIYQLGRGAHGNRSKKSKERRG